MKQDSKHELDHMIRDILKNNEHYVFEQRIKTPDELKYTYDKNIKTKADADAFATWVYDNYTFDFKDLGIKRRGNVVNDPKLRKAFKMHGKEWIDATGHNADASEKPFYTKSWFIWSAVVGIILVVSYTKFKIVQKIVSLLARSLMGLRKYRALLASHKMAPQEIDEIIEMAKTFGVGFRGRRKKFIKDQIARFLEEQGAKNSQQNAERIVDVLEKNPAVQNSIRIEITGALAENFMKGNGVTAKNLKNVMTPENWKKYGKEFEAIESKRKRGIKPKTSSGVKAAKVALTPMGKLMGNKGKVWAQLEGKAISADEITKAASNAIKGTPAETLKQRINISSIVSNKLKKSAGTKTGTWLLTKHANANTFPEFSVWKSDLRSAGVSRQLSETSYYVSKAIWNLTK